MLVADDEDAVRRVAVRILERAGFETVEAENGSAAVDRWLETKGDFRAVLLDLRMPVMTGEEALRELRALDPKLPILLASGYSSDQIVLDEHDAGTEFLAKPYRRDTLLSAMRRILDE